MIHLQRSLFPRCGKDISIERSDFLHFCTTVNFWRLLGTVAPQSISKMSTPYEVNQVFISGKSENKNLSFNG